MVGSSVTKLLLKKGYSKVITVPKSRLNLMDQRETFKFLQKNLPDLVIIAAAKVGGILSNNIYRAEYLYENLQIQNNLIHGSHLAKVKNLIFLGSSCIYPKISKQPIKEKYLLNSILEETNEPYAIAKIAGVKLCENYKRQYKSNYISLMPCNLYGQNDNFDTLNSHFLPALIKKIYLAKKNRKKYIHLWGNGLPKRELLHVDDLAEACIHFMKKNISEYYLNIGSGVECTIKKYAKMIMKIYDYKAEIIFDKSKPNGTPRKLLDSSLANKYGWHPKIELIKGLSDVCGEFERNNE